MVHQGRHLSKVKNQYAKEGRQPYFNIKEQNLFLMKTVFDPMGNYVYHRNCVMCVFDVRSARLAHLRKIVAEQKSHSIVTVVKEKVPRVSDVVFPMDCTTSPAEWLEAQPKSSDVVCRNHPERHGNAGKRSNNAKDGVVLQKFLEFVDNNSASNGRKEGSHGPTFYFSPKFTMLRVPNKDDPQYEYIHEYMILQKHFLVLYPMKQRS